MQTLTDTEIRTLYEKRQAEPFPQRKNVMGILIAAIFFVGVFALYLLFWWLLVQLFGGDSLPEDVINVAKINL